jgi:erythromycin 3''-O-methyltransferase
MGGTGTKEKRRWPLQNRLIAISHAVRMFTTPPEKRVRWYYELYNPAHFPTKNTLYVNLGYWSPGCSSLDDACQALADVLADAVGMQAGDRVLDAGFGYADQDMHWLETRKPERIVGLNITPTQVQLARQRAKERNLDDRLELRVGSATAMPFEAETFDRVVALESAFHFDTRFDFFRQAYRVLRPGGRIATADVVPLRDSQGPRTPEAKLEERGRKFVVPQANWYPAETYAERLRAAGFVDVEIRPITEYVYKPLLKYMTDYFHELTNGPDPVDPVQRAVIWRHIKAIEAWIEQTDYVIASGRKPAS